MAPSSHAFLRDLTITVVAIAVGVVLFQSRAPSPSSSPRRTRVAGSPAVLRAPESPASASLNPFRSLLPEFTRTDVPDTDRGPHDRALVGDELLFIRTASDRFFSPVTLQDLPSVAGDFSSGVRYQDDVFLIAPQLSDGPPGQLLRYRTADGSLVAQLNRRAGACENPVSLAVVRDTIYVACWERGVVEVDLRTEGVVRTYGTDDGLRDLRVGNLLVDGETLWVGGDNGIARIDLANGKVRWYDSAAIGVRGGYTVRMGLAEVWARGARDARYDAATDQWVSCDPVEASRTGPRGGVCDYPYSSGGSYFPGEQVLGVEVPIEKREYLAVTKPLGADAMQVLLSTIGVEVLFPRDQIRNQAFPTVVARSTFGFSRYGGGMGEVARANLVVTQPDLRYVVVLYAVVEGLDQGPVPRYTIGTYDRSTNRYVEGFLDRDALPPSSPLRSNEAAKSLVSAATATLREEYGEIVVRARDQPGAALTIDLSGVRVRPLVSASP